MHSFLRHLQVRLLAMALVFGVLPMLSMLVSPAAGQLSRDDPEWVLISRGKAGPFEAGMTVDEVYRIIGRENVRLVATFEEGMFGAMIEIRLSETHVLPALTASIGETPCPPFRLRSIEIHSVAFRTAEGMGVGSSLEEIQAVYPVDLTWGHGGHVAIARDHGVAFIFDVHDLEPTSTVTSVVSYLLPNEVRRERC